MRFDLKKILFTIILNVVLFAVVIFLIEFILYIVLVSADLPKYNSLKFKTYHDAYEYIKENKMRKPMGLEFDKRPILIMGCSFAYGWSLFSHETLQGQLAEIMQRPVYNRAFEMWGPQNMLYQSRLDEFYEEVPNPEFVIYVLMDDHIRRINSQYGQIFNEYPYVHYHMENSRLVEDKYNFAYNSLLLKKLNTFKFKHMSDEEKIKDLNEYFIETKQEFDKHWKDYKFIILIYDEKEVLSERLDKSHIMDLENQGFIILRTRDLVGRYLDGPDDRLKIEKHHPHPSRYAWIIVADKLAEKLNEMQVEK